MKKYIILADRTPETLALLATSLKYFYSELVLPARNAQECLQHITEHGPPQLLVVSHELLEEEGGVLRKSIEDSETIVFPVIAITERPLDDFLNTPVVTAWLERPIDVDHFSELVRSYVEITLSSIPSHVSLDIDTVLLVKSWEFDYYLRLSGRNYVKITHQGQPFTEADGEKLRSKGIREIYIKASECFNFLRIMEANQNKVAPGSVEEVRLAIRGLEQMEKIARALGWSPEVVREAEAAVLRAMSVLGKDRNLVELLENKMSSGNPLFSSHTGLLSLLLCSLSSRLHLPGENGPLKLALAALLHDVALDDDYYSDVAIWNKRGGDPEIRTPEAMVYRHHPLEGAKIAQAQSTLPPDIDRIILQHHERPDGSGFPRSLTASRITHLAAVFIITEDLTNFLLRSVNPVTGIKDFLTWGESYYDQGNFKRIFVELKEKLSQQL